MYKPIFKDNELVNKEETKLELLRQAKERGFNLNFDNPKTIQDKLNYLKIYENMKLKTLCADKIKIHEYCKEKLGKDICVPILSIYNDTSEINIDLLPDKFVLKCNHGWNMNILCKDKKNFDVNTAKGKINKWLNTDWGNIACELHYLNIDKKCFAEQFLDGGENGLIDYKFWCFNGEPKLYTINSDNGHVGGTDIIYYDMKGNEVPVYNKTNRRVVFDKPHNFDDMIEYAKILAQNFKFVRVDFYEINGVVYLGELTFTPGACLFRYNNPYNEIIGEYLKL